MGRHYPSVWLMRLALWMSILFPLALLEAEEAVRQSSPALPGEPCHIAPLPTWTPQERWVWDQICRGKSADFNTANDYGGMLSPQQFAAWPTTRVLRSVFLEVILLHEPFRSAVPRQGVRIRGAWFTEPLDLSFATLTQPLVFLGCRFESVVSLAYLRTSASVWLDGSMVMGQLMMAGLHVDNDLFMRHGATFTEVYLVGARIGGQLSMIKATVTGLLVMDGLHVMGGLLMRDGATFAEVRLHGATIDGNLDMTTTTVTKPLVMDSLHVSGNLFMRDGATFTEISLRGAKIGGQLSMIKATVTGLLMMDHLHVVGGLFMHDKATFANVNLISAQIGSQLTMITATVTGTLDMDGLHVGGPLLMHEGAFANVNLIGAQIGSQLDMTTAMVTGTLNMDALHVNGSLFMGGGATFTEVSLRGARIGGQLSMTTAMVTGTLDMDGLHVGRNLSMREGAKFAQSIHLIFATIGSNLDLAGAHLASLDLTGTRIGGELRLGLGGHIATWQLGAWLNLRNTDVGAVQDAPEAWPETLILDGFLYGRLGGLAPQDAAAMAARDVAWWINWLHKQARYTSQPYEQLASVLQKAGYQNKATAILYASKRKEESQTTRLESRVGLWLQRVLIGYGY